MPLEIVRRLLQHGMLNGSRSTVVTMLAWMAATLASCMLGTVVFNAPNWMQVFVATMLGVDFFLFVAAYIYFGFTDKDALRSERYSIQKLAIEYNLIGDKAAGLFDSSADDPDHFQIGVTPSEGGER